VTLFDLLGNPADSPPVRQQGAGAEESAALRVRIPMGEATERKHITIFTGNSCQNPGRGGYGVVLAWSDGDYHKELSGPFPTFMP
jgi:hypothetical protein